MADFCYGCLLDDAPEYVLYNDFRGIVDVGERLVGLCEGCGMHLFDHEGKRHCSPPSWYADPENVVLFDCPECFPPGLTSNEAAFANKDEHP